MGRSVRPCTLTTLPPSVGVGGPLAGCRDGAVTFMPRSITAASMPFAEQSSPTWRRRSGAYQLHIEGHTRYGVPYGRHARIFAMWLSQETLRSEKQTFELSDPYSQYLNELNLDVDGNTRKRFCDQANRFLSSRFLLDGKMVAVADRYELHWDRRWPNQLNLFQSYIRLSSAYYDHLLTASIPLDRGIIRSFKRSPWDIDLYSWLTWRFSYLRTGTAINYESLREQFGCTYKQRKHFCRALKKHVAVIQRVYPGNYACTKNGMILRPSPTSVRKIGKRSKRRSDSADQMELFGRDSFSIQSSGSNEAEVEKREIAAAKSAVQRSGQLQPISKILSTIFGGKEKLSTCER